MPGPKSGMRGLMCVDREGTACTKVVLQSRVRIWHWWLALLLFQGVFAVLCPVLFGWWTFSPLVGVSPCSFCRSLLSLFPVVLAALLLFFSWLSRWFRGRPGRAAVLVSSVSATFVPGILSSGSSTLVFLPILTWLRILAVFAAFSELRCARQVESFAECSFRHLPPVVFPSWRAASEFF